ncbi:MAG: hypothetical protein ACP5JG_04680 [Anaerolineae bacterium]
MNEVKRTPKSDRLLGLVCALCALLAAAPLWGPGIVNTRGGGDSPFLLQRTMDMADNLRHGILPARWMAHAAYDLGYPFFNHYAAFPYYLSGGLLALGLNVLLSIQITQTLGFVMAALTMALWAKNLYRRRSARMLVVAAYTFVPFHLVNVYVRGDSLSEFYAFVWYPLILWTLDRVTRRPRFNRIFAAALAYGGLILTHNVSALIFSPFALLYGLFAVERSRRSETREGESAPGTAAKSASRKLLGLMAIFALGIALTAWFWAPAIAEIRYGQLGTEFTEGYFHYSRHFRDLDLVQRSPFFSYSVASSVEQAGPFAMGLVQTILTLTGAIWLLRRYVIRHRKAHLWQTAFLIAGFLISTVMITPLSRPLWAHLPLLSTTQFPWRFLSVQAVFSSALIGAIAEMSPRKSRSVNGLITAALVVLLAAASLGTLRPDRLLINPDDVTWDQLRLYESFTGNIGTTIRHEYLPEDVVPRLYISEAVIDGRGSVIADGDVVLNSQQLERTPVKQVWSVELDAGSTAVSGSIAVSFPLNWWPGWQADVNGKPVETYPMPGSGRLTVDLEAGENHVVLRLGNTPLRKAAVGCSAAAVVAGIGVLVLSAKRSDRTKNPARRSTLRWLLAATLVSVVGPTGLQRTTADDAVFYDFEEMPFPHAGPVDFEVVQLQTAHVASGDTAPGDPVTVMLNWTGLPSEPLTVTLRLVSPAEPRHNIPYGLAEVSTRVTPVTKLELPLPEDLSRGLYLVQLRLFGPSGELRGHTGRGRGMGRLYVGDVRQTHSSAPPPPGPELASFRDLVLHVAEATQARPERLRLKLVWSTPSGTPRNWRLSFRLMDDDGRLVQQRDWQPGYDYLPTTLWLPGESMVDYPLIDLPEGLAPGDYTLKILTYLQATAEGGGEAEIPIRLTSPTLYDLRDACCEQTRKGATILCQTGEIALLNVDAPETVTEGEDLSFTAEWNALLRPTADITATWTLDGPGGGTVSEIVRPLAPGSRTSTWPRHTWVLAPFELDLSDPLAEGTYSLRLRLTGEEDEVDCGAVKTIQVALRPRSFVTPQLSYSQEAKFGEVIQLLGYGLEEEHDTLALTLWWKALTTPEADYKRFVHLYDPETEAIPVQDDAMPRHWQYPTTLWLKGEVVSETVKLDLTGTPQGEYRLGIGWYHPETMDRLPAIDVTSNQRAPGDRFTLRSAIRR